MRHNLRLVRRLFQNPPAVLDELHAEFGPAVEVGPTFSPIVVLGSPGLIQQMFATPAERFAWRNRANIVGVRFVVGRTSMIVSDGKDHDRRRGPVQPLFARRRLDEAVPTIVELTDRALAELVTELGDGRTERDLYPFGRLLLLGITLRVMFGERLAAQTEAVARRYERPQAYIEAPAIRQLPHPFPFTERARVRRDRHAVDDMLTEELARRQQESESAIVTDGAARGHGVDRPADVLDVLVADGTLSRREILDQARTIIGAGYDTTAASLAWMLLSAAGTNGLWERLRIEADAVLGPAGAGSSHADATAVSQLELAGRTVRESLRLHPAGVIGVRMAADDLTLGDFRIRRGSLIAWSPHLAGRDEATWDRPLEFDPDRFVHLDAAQEAAAQRAWIPFGRGPHGCLGFGLAQMELTLILARMAQTLDLAPVTDAMPAAHGLIVNRPVGGARLRVAVRAAGTRHIGPGTV